MGYPHFAPTLLWNFPLPSELGIKKPASTFAFSPDDKLLLTLHEDQGGVLWDVTAGRAPWKLEFDQNDACLRWSVKAAALQGIDEGFLVAFGIEHPSQHYNVRNGQPNLIRSDHLLTPANDITISRDGKLIVLATAAAVELWDPRSFQRVRVLVPQIQPQSSFKKTTVSRNKEYVAAVETRGRLAVWGISGDTYKAPPDNEADIELGDEWSPTSVGLSDDGFVMATMRKPTPSGQDNWMLISWGYKYDGPENTLYAKEYPDCALACVAPSAEFNITLTPEGHLSGKDCMLWPLFVATQGVSKKGKVISCGISRNGKLLAAARSNGRLMVWKLYTKDADPNEPYPG